MKSVILLITIFFSNNLIAHELNKPPELCSWFKEINKTKQACLTQSFLAVSEVNLKNTTQNEFGIYGNVKSNRVVVKCMPTRSNKSMLMVAVAGSNRKEVENLRNKIVQLIK